VLRVPGMLYQQQAEGRISNLYNVQFVNKSFDPLPLTLKLEDNSYGTIRVVGGPIWVAAGATAEVVCFIELPRTVIHQTKTQLKIGVYHGGQQLETVKTNFLGPVQ
jgi:ribosomal protein S28E/S33